VPAAADADDDIGWAASVDTTVCRAHQLAAGARKVTAAGASRLTMAVATGGGQVDGAGPGGQREPAFPLGPWCPVGIGRLMFHRRSTARP
jgi:hypothetical protein